MKHGAPVVAAVICCLIGGVAGAAETPAEMVDPFIGTSGHGHTFPGATLPFGMVQLSPDTRLEGWDGCSGYHDDDTVVHGFSHTHLSGTGVSDYGDVLLMPVTGEPSLTAYASRFDKTSERAEPGYYAVELADHGVGVELTVTERAGLHRYRFRDDRPAHVVVDLKHRDEVYDSQLRVVNDREIEGYRWSVGWAEDQRLYFVARFSRPFDAKLARNDETRPDKQRVRGKNVKGILSFGEGAGELLVKVGISGVDVAGARKNLEAELPAWDFDATRRAAAETWDDALGRIAVEGGTAEQRTIFYTALYHSLLAPNLFSDVDGRYRGMDTQIHRAVGRRHYTVFSLWDTFRATHPLFTLIETERTRELVLTMLEQYRQAGRLPVWELAGNETDTMIGYHAVPVIADAWLKGIRGYSGALALDAMLGSADREHFGLAAYREKGFIGSDDYPESVSRTLEYAFDDACIARMAADLGLEQTAERFTVRSQGWRNLFDPQTGFMRPREHLRWLEPFDPRRVDNNYTEANAWQYSFFVPHDVEGLIQALGGDERFVERLDELFETDDSTTGRTQADITGRIGQYAHGNEPSHHMAWLYHYAGRPDRSIDRVRQVLDTQYTAARDGLSGNEDCGQMSSWYLLSAAGIYPVDACSGVYVLGSPIFERVTFRPDTGKRFTIRAKGAGEGLRYVTGARLNGKRLDRSYLRHEEIARGGSLVLTLGESPDPQWGRSAENRPSSTTGEPRSMPAPVIRGVGQRFRDRASVELQSLEPGAEIHYFVQPGPAGVEWQPYREPIELTLSSLLRFYAVKGDRKSPVVQTTIHRMPNDWAIELAAEPNPQYAAGGPDALIDGLYGRNDWRTGGWHGIQYADFEAVVDLREPRTVRRVGGSFLQDVRSWIWMPRKLTVSVSDDGRNFREVAVLESGVPDDQKEVVAQDIETEIEPVEARWVRFHAESYGTIPDWHPGRGEGAFIFVDELLVK